ncbi:putative Late nodulin [Medicago truncatula]|uniref:Nodule Cysteine-Rich (NCR) secreted peptide n=1 Tax=Medicago truncatula TaxID=3880 RepID=A7KH77_MEDTR|nr:nodule-specific cysteine-rich peptide 65 [Medicago truncatula]AES66910.1 Nodule Cysteine-Rich (NCR) secreted peptide [Medicago truncatula]RHN75297.1 putative Late nodulin [Medicago truncatula]
MARVISLFYALIIFLFLFLVATNGDLSPCLRSGDCSKDECPSHLVPKCIGLTCYCI